MSGGVPVNAPMIDTLLDAIHDLDHRALRYEIEGLRAIKEWSIRQCCDFTEADKVEMNGTLNLTTLGGWARYAEAMAEGSTATVQRIDFNQHYGYWYADIIFDREWSTGWKDARYWHGPADETPEGYEPPSKFDQEHYPEGRKHTFAMPVKYLRKAFR